MLGSKPRMPKRYRYPIFILGLAIMLLGGLAAQLRGAPPSTIAVTTTAGFALLVAAVLPK